MEYFGRRARGFWGAGFFAAVFLLPDFAPVFAEDGFAAAFGAGFEFAISRLYSFAMANGNSNVPGGPPIFSAILTPYRSLDRRGFRILMICVGLVCFVSGLPFLLLGAWPVFLFFSLDVFLVWLAFRLNYRSARAFEEVEVFAESVKIRQVSARGKVATHEFNPYWARLSVHEIEDEGVARITLTSHGRSLDVGTFLNPPDKESFAAAFRHALMQARGMAPA